MLFISIKNSHDSWKQTNGPPSVYHQSPVLLLGPMWCTDYCQHSATLSIFFLSSRWLQNASIAHQHGQFGPFQDLISPLGASVTKWIGYWTVCLNSRLEGPLQLVKLRGTSWSRRRWAQNFLSIQARLIRVWAYWLSVMVIWAGLGEGLYPPACPSLL